MSRPSWIALTAAAAIILAGCSGGSGGSKQGAAASSTPSSRSASPTPGVPEGAKLTDPGAALAFGEPGSVIFEPARRGRTVLRVTVQGVQRGRLADFNGFILDDSYKRKASYYYTRVSVRNVGEDDVGGAAVPLWGVSATNVLLPAVNFTTRFPRCPSSTLPRKFPPGASMRTCLVYLSPNQGALTSVSYRGDRGASPVTWRGDITRPAPAKKTPTKKSTPKKSPTKSPDSARNGT